MSGTKARPGGNVYEVFLSHNSKDKSWIDQIAVELDDLGITVFYDKWDLIPGRPWQEDVEKALSESASCAIFVGKAGFGPWQTPEMRVALSRQTRDRTFRVMPVLLPGGSFDDMPPFLGENTGVDLAKDFNDREARNRLVAGILGKPPGRPRP